MYDYSDVRNPTTPNDPYDSNLPPSLFLYTATGATNNTVADRLSTLFINQAASVNAIASFSSSKAVLQFFAKQLSASFLNISDVTWAGYPFTQAVNSVGGSSFPSPLFATSAVPTTTLQRDPALSLSRTKSRSRGSDGSYNPGGGALLFAVQSCTAPVLGSLSLSTPVSSYLNYSLSYTTLVANALGSSNVTATAMLLQSAFQNSPLNANTSIEAFFTLLGAAANLPLACVSLSPTRLNSSDAINQLLFSGYGKGSTGNQGTAHASSPVAQFGFAVDYRNSNFGPGAALVHAVRVFYNNTGMVNTGSFSPGIAFRRIPSVVNALANAWIQAAINSNGNPLAQQLRQPPARLLYLRDMPKPSSSLTVDFYSFLGPLFYSWLAQLVLPIMVSLLMYEKEKNLRTMMKMQVRAPPGGSSVLASSPPVQTKPALAGGDPPLSSRAGS